MALQSSEDKSRTPEAPEPRYSITIPITLPSDRPIEVGEGVCFRCAPELRIEFVPDFHFGFQTLRVGQFSSEEDARKWLNRVAVALYSLIPKYQIGLLFDPVPAALRLFDPPMQIQDDSPLARINNREWQECDGITDGRQTVIVPDHKKIFKMTTGRPTISLGLSANALMSGFDEGLQYKTPELILNNRKLRLAIEIYASSFFETSGRATFVTRMMVLEALAIAGKRPDPLVDCVQEFLRQLNSKRQPLLEVCESEDFESLVGSLRLLKERSISQKIRSLLLQVLGSTPEGARISEFKRAYEVRSRLIHDGEAPADELSNAISTVNALVPALLNRLLLLVGNGDPVVGLL